MALLSDSDRHLCGRRHVIRAFVEGNVTANLPYDAIKAAADAADQWADDNASAFNLALPVAFRNAATLQQKSLLLAIVILKRAGFDL
jgi:hypothetical protein